MLIYAIIMGGLANLIIGTRQHSLHQRFRITAGELGRYFLERLQMQVDQSTWDAAGNYLTEGEYKSSGNTCSGFDDYNVVAWLNEPVLNGITYYPAQKVIGKDGLHKVKLTICWQEPTP